MSLEAKIYRAAYSSNPTSSRYLVPWKDFSSARCPDCGASYGFSGLTYFPNDLPESTQRRDSVQLIFSWDCSAYLIVATWMLPFIARFILVIKYTAKGYILWQRLAYCSPNPFLPTATFHFVDFLAIMSRLHSGWWNAGKSDVCYTQAWSFKLSIQSTILPLSALKSASQVQRTQWKSEVPRDDSH